MEDLSDIYAQEKSAWLYILDLLVDGDIERAEELIHAAVPIGVYRHFKSSVRNGERLYLVSGWARETDSKEYRVHYHPLYGEKRGTAESRALLSWQDGFIVPVKRKGYRGRRFTLVRRLSPGEYQSELTKLDLAA